MSTSGSNPFNLQDFGPSRRRRGEEPPRPRLGKLFDIEPPSAPEAEMSLLGSMLLDGRVISDVINLVRGPEAFYSDAHAAIYQAVVEYYDKHRTVDLVQITDTLRDRKVLDALGGPAYLVRLAEGVPSSVNAPHYARLVSEKHKLRRLIDAAGQVLYDAYHAGQLGPEGAREVVDVAEQRIFEIAQEQQSSDPQLLKDLLQIELDRLDSAQGVGISGVPTGYHELDELLSGMQPGELIILAARPSMGKTALALNIVEQIALGSSGPFDSAARPGHPVGLFSLEMSKSSVTQRLISARSGISTHAMRTGRLHESDYQKLIAACSELGESTILVDDTPGLTALQLRARARRMVAQHGVRALMIDYLQLLSAPNAARESRQVEVSAISRSVKALARELNVPVICLSQLNRGPESRESNRPRLSDLRESGSIEQDADVVVLLHREEYYHVGNPEWAADPDNADKVGVAELIVAKQRNGPTGMIRLTWDAHTTRFKNYASGHSAYQPPAHVAPRAAPLPAQPAPFASAPRAAAPDAAPRVQFPASGPGGPPAFAPGGKSGPVADFRDGGGPDRDEEPLDLPPPDTERDEEPPF
ncbi:MAG: replicative DNA helicase [Phycisphaerae bacterium]|nr:replicative DNA helicase [Phycisphaerae bacterium]